MKIVGLAVEQIDSSEKEIVIRARLAANEELEPGDIAFLVGQLSEVAGMGDTQRLKGGAEGEQNSTAEPAGRRARRSGAAPSAEPAQTAEAPTTGRRSRRGSADSAPVQSEPTASSASSAEPASEGRRARRPRGESATDPTSSPTRSSEPETAPAAEGRASRRTSRSAPPAGRDSTPTTTSRSDRKIEDADLSKAASIAARVITPKGVMAILDDFGAKQSSDVPAEFRAQFLEALDEAVAKASKK